MSVKKTTKEDSVLDSTLRPRNWEEFIGQENLKKNIKVIIEAAKKRGQTPDHLLFYGGPGLGKTTLAYLIAKEMGANMKVSSGPAIEKPGSLAAILTNLSPGDILFIDEIHRLPRICEEFLYPAIEEYKLNITLGQGPMAKTIDFDLPRFTLIGATTRIALISSPLRSRFGATFHLDFYTTKDIQKIIEQSASILNIKIEKEAAEIIAQRSRFTPRIANRLLKRIRDYAEVEGQGLITKETAQKGLAQMQIDELGLESQDRRLLKIMIEKFNGGPIGLKTISSAISDEEDNIVSIYEPYLIQMGLIKRTPRGRIVTDLAYRHLGIKKSNQSLL